MLCFIFILYWLDTISKDFNFTISRSLKKQWIKIGKSLHKLWQCRCPSLHMFLLWCWTGQCGAVDTAAPKGYQPVKKKTNKKKTVVSSERHLQKVHLHKIKWLLYEFQEHETARCQFSNPYLWVAPVLAASNQSRDDLCNTTLLALVGVGH